MLPIAVCVGDVMATSVVGVMAASVVDVVATSVVGVVAVGVVGVTLSKISIMLVTSESSTCILFADMSMVLFDASRFTGIALVTAPMRSRGYMRRLILRAGIVTDTFSARDNK